MQSTPSSLTLLPREWAKVLEQIQHILTQVAADAATREQTFTANLPSLPDRDPQHHEPTKDALDKLQACLHQAERNAHEVETALELEAATLQRGLADLEAAHRQLEMIASGQNGRGSS